MTMSAAIDHLKLQANKLVINHDIMNCTADGIVGNHLFSGRALGISEPWDMIQLHPDLRPLMNDICTHYKHVGLSFSTDILWSLNRKHLGEHIGYQPSVFYYGHNENRYWGDYAWKHIVDIINSKNNFMRLAIHLGINVPYTICVDSVTEIGQQIMEDIVYPCYLKAAVSVAGVGIYRCQDQLELQQAIIKFDANVPIQIQEEIKTETFLNLQYKVVNNEPVRLAASEQILDGFAHQGNRVPAGHEPWDVVDDMAYWLVQHGMKGIFAFDVAVEHTPYGPRFTAIECNPRFNGATYPTLIAQKLGIKEWSAITMDTRHRSLATIDLDQLEYDAYRGEGVILVNWGTVLAGKLSVLLVGSAARQMALATELEARFG
jgi:hypothetical protein